MIKVGITGGIGSGKSTVCEIFKQFGVPVFDSDKIAKQQYLKSHVKEATTKIVGNEILSDGEVDMNKLREILFADKPKLEAIAKVIHPALLEDFELFCIKNAEHIYCLFESAIIFEQRLTHLFDKIITVTADKDTRIKRVMKRNNVSEQEVLDRMNLQIDDKYKIDRSDFVIRNNGEDLYTQIQELHTDIVLTATEPYNHL